MNLHSRTMTLIGNFYGIPTPLVFVVPVIGKQKTYSTEIKKLNIIGFGELAFTGEKKSIEITFDGFFPNMKSPFFNIIKNPLPPQANISLLKKWCENGTPCTLVTPETFEYVEVYIESVTETEEDFTNDVYFNVNLVERRLYSRATNGITGLFSRLS